MDHRQIDQEQIATSTAPPSTNPLLLSLQKIADSKREVKWDTCCRYTTPDDEEEND